MNKSLDIRSYTNEARHFGSKAEYDKAVVVYKRVVRIDRKAYDPHYFWALTQKDQQKYRYAELKFREVLVLDPQHYYALTSMGTCLLNQGKYDQAISFFKRGLEIRPDDHHTIYNLAVAVTKVGDYEEAMRLCGKGIKAYAYNGLLHDWVGYLYFLQGKYKEAIEKFDSAMMYYEYEMLHFNKALVIFCQDVKEEEVKKVFEMGIQINKKRSQKRLFMRIAVDHYNDEMNRIGKELGCMNLGCDTRGRNLGKLQKGLEYILNLLKIEMEKLEN